MSKVNNRHIGRLAALSLLLFSGVCFASEVYSGTVSHDEYITVPFGTTTDDWAILISPSVMGTEEPNSEADNALLKFETYVYKINMYTWRVVARYKFKGSNSYPNGWWGGGTANYIMIRKD